MKFKVRMCAGRGRVHSLSILQRNLPVFPPTVWCSHVFFVYQRKSTGVARMQRHRGRLETLDRAGPPHLENICYSDRKWGIRIIRIKRIKSWIQKWWRKDTFPTTKDKQDTSTTQDEQLKACSWTRVTKAKWLLGFSFSGSRETEFSLI